MKAKNSRKKHFTGWDTAIINGKKVNAYYQDYGGYEYVCTDADHVYEDVDGELVLFPNLKASDIGCTAFGKNGSTASGKNGGTSFLSSLTSLFSSNGTETNASGTVKAESTKVGLQKNSTLLWVGIGGAVLVVVLIMVLALRK